MLSLIVFFLFGLAVAYFAIQNTLGVTMVLANNIFTGVPLYLIVIGSILTGIVLSWIISGLNAISVYRKLRGKEKVIESDQREIHALKEKVAALETENVQLKEQRDERHTNVEFEEREEQKQRPSFFSNLFHPRTEHR